MGDACHTQGPEGGIGLNFNYQVCVGFRDYLREHNMKFDGIGKFIQDLYENQSLAATEI